MSELNQQIRFCKARDGVRIAYSTMGSGPPLVKAAHFLTHLEHDLRTPVWRPWLEELSRDRTLVRYDAPGCGLSDRESREVSVDRWLADLEAVVDAAGLDRFALFGGGQGSMTSVAYAVKHPHRVTRLIVYSGYARGLMRRSPTPEQIKHSRLVADLIELAWGQDNPAFRQVFTSLFVPGSSPEVVEWFNELERVSTSPEHAARIVRAFFEADVSELAPRVTCPTLVAHVRGDTRIPFEEGRLLASLIPGARFLPLEGRNHALLPYDPAFAAFFSEVRGFLTADEAPPRREPAFGDLTQREREILELLAHGLGNHEIAARLGLSEKTVRNNVTTIFDKLGVTTRAQAVARARDAGFAAAPLDRRAAP
jgi:pimeloyl-ACP methyl ester carboxylesterase/DNA-binding CsgD family transcriptional regulator